MALLGFSDADPAPRFRTAGATRDAVAANNASDDAKGILADVDLVQTELISEVDLGGRSARIEPLRGHTRSDLIVELPEEGIIWCGDLVWNQMFPNYMDAVPSQLSESVRSLVRDGSIRYVPGHGPMADGDDLSRYLSVIDAVETAARAAAAAGKPAAEAAKEFQLPEPARDWVLFSPRYFEVALTAWEKELKS